MALTCGEILSSHFPHNFAKNHGSGDFLYHRVRLRIMSKNQFLRCTVSGFYQTWFLPVESTLLNTNKIKIAPSSLNSIKIVIFSTKLNLIQSRKNSEVSERCDTFKMFFKVSHLSKTSLFFLPYNKFNLVLNFTILLLFRLLGTILICYYLESQKRAETRSGTNHSPYNAETSSYS